MWNGWKYTLGFLEININNKVKMSIAEALNFRLYRLKIPSGDRKTPLAATRDNFHDWYILSLDRLSSSAARRTEHFARSAR